MSATEGHTDFIAVDVETANPDYASICQIGLARASGGKIVEVTSTLVNPEDIFTNTYIHGINEEKVKDAPLFPAALGAIKGFLSSIVVSHSAFDRVAISRAYAKYGLEMPSIDWLDSVRVARRVWPERRETTGFGLSALAWDLEIDFQHHDAGEDARVAAEVVIRACAESGRTVEDWRSGILLERKNRNRPIALDGNSDGVLFGEVIVFTGALRAHPGSLDSC